MKLADLPNRDSIEQIREITRGEEEAEHLFLSEYLVASNTSNGVEYKVTSPEEWGALTSAPMIAGGGEVYGYMDYQIKNFLDELAEGNEIEWQRG
ncbi:MAG TPA: hypothetical protein PKX15_00295 [Bacteroidales bacterium]|nr:hypothetical protein [Bacteroidales bacterium]